jgi:hypothetical protein
MKRVITKTHFAPDEEHFYYKKKAGKWITDAYTQDRNTIELKQLQLYFTLKKIYKPA